ncbi:MAG TPA: protein kinase [Candidatus Sulfopaludibacter sp.]|jgi:serine/threonine-protein kinase|nr:protein kinase [Candidatus Sulfopaludibacter sp.]
MVGRTISHYNITQKLGAGGMGEIYKAQDTRLNRTVAIKVLSGAHAGTEERRMRFMQEAQAASALNHPNIITIHDIVSSGDGECLVMEFVSGKTLGDLIPKDGLPLSVVLDYAVQVASALEAAHGAGIVHRDLKPGNVMVTDAGLVKVLDFGLAKLMAPTGEDVSLGDETQTVGTPLTVEGSILGTVSYMSPEQAEGKPVDARSDVFAFGAMLHEMVTGERAFSGDSTISTLSSILRDEARPLTHHEGVPPSLQNIVERCLRKKRDERWQSMQAVRAALSMLKRDSDSGTLFLTLPPETAAPRKAKPPYAWIGGGVAVLLLAVGGIWVMTRPKPRPPAIVVQMTPPPAPILETPPPVVETPAATVPTPPPVRTAIPKKVVSAPAPTTPAVVPVTTPLLPFRHRPRRWWPRRLLRLPLQWPQCRPWWCRTGCRFRSSWRRMSRPMLPRIRLCDSRCRENSGSAIT